MTTPRRTAVLCALLALLGLVFWFRVTLYNRSKQPESPEKIVQEALKMLRQTEDANAKRYWGPELLAETYSHVAEDVWDKLNLSSNKLAELTNVHPGKVILPAYGASESLPHHIMRSLPTGIVAAFNAGQWLDWIQSVIAEGWTLSQCEFRHNEFKTNKAAFVSRFYFSAHLSNSRSEQRAILEGDLFVTWGGKQGAPAIAEIDASHIQARTRTGPLPFREILNEEIVPIQGSYFIDPVIVWDLNNDGTPEVILAAKNAVYRPVGDDFWTQLPLCAQPPRLIFTGLLGDFTGDGKIDFLCATFDGLLLYEGNGEASFRGKPRNVWTAQPRLKYAQALVAGDIDGDGDLDLFLGQYKVPYDKGQMPRPYFDANDGHPSFLLENDGSGNFTDITQKAGLGPKRGRRVYNASFVDLDSDGHLDLVVVSDFAGLDVYRNDGHGRFQDVTHDWLNETHGFGMANAFADFNLDGRLDLLMIGMNSPTANRLNGLNLSRPYEPADQGMRSRVTYGNRLIFGTGSGKFEQLPMGETVARTGWSWGCAAEDFDNDGTPDLYIANGHETRASVRDYETEFWLHDIYQGNSQEDPLNAFSFRDRMSRTRGTGWSYGGYEKNRFFQNLGGTNFVECAYLMGIALEQDSRNVVAEDLDGDGRLDLIVTTFEVFPKVRQTLRVFRNELPIENTLAELTFHDLKHTGKVIQDGRGSAQAILSSGSYRSQIQPRLRGTTGELQSLISKLGLKTNDYTIR